MMEEHDIALWSCSGCGADGVSSDAEPHPKGWVVIGEDAQRAYCPKCAPVHAKDSVE